MEFEVDVNSSEEPPPVLAPLRDGDGVPMQWLEKGATGYRGGVVYRATTSRTFYVNEDNVNIFFILGFK